MTPVDRVVNALRGHGRKVTQTEKGYSAQCPAHSDKSPSLSVSESATGAALVYCHAGCTLTEVLGSIGLAFRDVFPEKPQGWASDGGPHVKAVYGYHDADGTLIYEVVRFDPKSFRQRQPNGSGGYTWNLRGVEKTLYQLPQVLRAVRDGLPIWLCEGEKDAENAQHIGEACHVGTTVSGGAITTTSGWLPQYTEALEGATRVVICADNDQTGITHARIVANALRGHVKELNVVKPTGKHKDLSAYLGAGLPAESMPVLWSSTGDDDSWLAGDAAEAASASENNDRLSKLIGQLVDWEEFWKRDHTTEQWIAQPIIPAGRGVSLYAPAKAGKSTIVLSIVAAVATGLPILGDIKSDPKHVLYLDYEMTEADLDERLTELGYGPDVDLSFLHYALLPSLPPLDTQPGADALIELAAYVDAELVVIDTFGRAVEGEENSNDTTRDFYRLTGGALKAAGRAWLRTDHSGKDVDRGVRGGSAKNDDVDVVWKLTRSDSGVRLDRTHTRIAWVPERIEIARVENDDGTIIFKTEAGRAYAAGTKEVAGLLDSLSVPLNATKRTARQALKNAGHKATNQALVDALRWRREGDFGPVRTPKNGSDQATDHVSGWSTDQTPGPPRTKSNNTRSDGSDQATDQNGPTSTPSTDQTASIDADQSGADWMTRLTDKTSTPAPTPEPFLDF